MPIIQGVAVIVLAWFTYKLFQDFGWEVLHLIGADRKLKVRRRFSSKQALLDNIVNLLIISLSANIHQVSSLRLFGQVRCESMIF